MTGRCDNTFPWALCLRRVRFATLRSRASLRVPLRAAFIRSRWLTRSSRFAPCALCALAGTALSRGAGAPVERGTRTLSTLVWSGPKQTHANAWSSLMVPDGDGPFGVEFWCIWFKFQRSDDVGEVGWLMSRPALGIRKGHPSPCQPKKTAHRATLASISREKPEIALGDPRAQNQRRPE